MKRVTELEDRPPVVHALESTKLTFSTVAAISAPLPFCNIAIVLLLLLDSDKPNMTLCLTYRNISVVDMVSYCVIVSVQTLSLVPYAQSTTNAAMVVLLVFTLAERAGRPTPCVERAPMIFAVYGRIVSTVLWSACVAWQTRSARSVDVVWIIMACGAGYAVVDALSGFSLLLVTIYDQMIQLCALVILPSDGRIAVSFVDNPALRFLVERKLKHKTVKYT